MERIKLSIAGMTCGHCRARVEKALDGLEGVSVESLDLEAAVVSLDSTRVSPPAITKAVADAGYEVTSINAA